LPIFPPLALLAGLTIDRELAAPASKSAWSLTSSSTVLALFMVAFTVAMGSGSWLPSAARAAIAQLPERLALWTTAAALVFGALVFSAWTGRRRTPAPLFAAFAIGLVIYTDAFSTVLAENSERRSTRELVQRAAAVINPTAQLVIYDTSLESLPFYLRTSRPIWIVWSGAKHSVMGSFYLAEYGAKPAPGYGRALLSFEEFDRAWGQYPSGRLAVFIKKKNLPRLTKNLPHEARILLEYDDLAVVTN